MGRSMFSAFALARRSGEDVEAIFRRLRALTAMLAYRQASVSRWWRNPCVHLMLGPAWMEAAPCCR